jgi:hypothetical protein
MIALPQSLADWTVDLDCFNDALQTAFAPWLPQLDALIGPPHAPRPQHDGEPEGFDGLTHRGRYERLLLSEWLLADEEPLEFMRRAAMGQHLFTALARKSPTQSRCCLVLFDTGPTQLGAPRLAQLALLIVLARRARRSATRLMWGSLQSPGELHADLVEAGVRRFLALRTLDLPESGWLRLWTEHLREIGLQTDERWLIGDVSDAREFGPTTTTISIREQAPEFRQLLVEARNLVGRQSTQSRLLDLPGDALALQILRDPFSIAAPPPRKKQPKKKRDLSCMMPPRIWLEPEGRRVFVRTSNGSVTAHHVPSKPTTAAGHARTYERRDGEHILAAGMRGKRVIALTCTPERVFLRKFLSNARDLSCDPPSDPEVAQALVAAALGSTGDGTMVRHGSDCYRYLTPSGLLLELRPDAQQKSALGIEPVASEVVAHSHTPFRLAYKFGDKLRMRQLNDGKETAIEMVPGLDDATRAQLAFVGVNPGTLGFYKQEQVLGAHKGKAPALLILSLRRKLFLHPVDRASFELTDAVHHFSHDVIATAFGDRCGLLALLTKDFVLHVYSCEQRQFLTRHHLEGSE